MPQTTDDEPRDASGRAIRMDVEAHEAGNHDEPVPFCPRCEDRKMAEMKAEWDAIR